MASSSMLPTIHAALGAASTLGYASSTAAHDVYEGYVLALFLQAASAEGWLAELRDGSDNPTTAAIFRLGPGRLPSGNFTHVRLTKAGKVDLEAHIGVKVRGASTLAHEFDLLLLPAAVAANCRRTNRDPSSADVVAHAEAKYYGGNIPLPVGRAVVGLAIDCGMTHHFHSSGKSVLVTNQNGPTVEKLVQYYGLTFRFLIKPSNSFGLYHTSQRFRAMLVAAP
jgi:hypothetical protein